MIKVKMTKTNLVVLSTLSILIIGGLAYSWNRFGPSENRHFEVSESQLPIANVIEQDTAECKMSILQYRQIGRDVQFLLYSDRSGIAPYSVEVLQNGAVQKFSSVRHRNNYWLEIKDLTLQNGKAVIRIKSLSKDCAVTASFDYDGERKNEILSANRWIREGSKDNMLDVRPVQKNGKLFLKDFANYKDGRTRVYLIDGVVVEGLENGFEVQPGYFYNVTSRWIDAPYNDWWNKLKKRDTRVQNLWIVGAPPSTPQSTTLLTPIQIPEWFSPSKDKRVQFDTQFPEFAPIKDKLVLQYRMNDDVPYEAYFKRGITHLPHWEENVPFEKKHWTESPGFFGDKDQEWFGKLSKEEVEAFADSASPDNVYVFDFEFWNMDYTPEVKQRLVWFAKRIRQRNPKGFVFDFWGGPAYRNTLFKSVGKIDPASFIADYANPKSNHGNFTKMPDQDFLGNYFNLTNVLIYPQPINGADGNGNTPNNYLILTALHNSRINKLIPFQKNNKTIWYTWNRIMPLSEDPAAPMHIATTDPLGDLFINQLEPMPASQALGIALFSLVTDDGYYLWHDDKPLTRKSNSYKIGKDDPLWGWAWYPADGVTDVSVFNNKYSGKTSPTYWDYPTDFMALGNWMAKQVEDVIVGGKVQDLPYKNKGTWKNPKPEQALLVAASKDPFVTSVVKGNKIVVIAIDSFQAPGQEKEVTIKLPNNKETTIRLYGNWPALYRGTLD